MIFFKNMFVIVRFYSLKPEKKTSGVCCPAAPGNHHLMLYTECVLFQEVTAFNQNKSQRVCSPEQWTNVQHNESSCLYIKRREISCSCSVFKRVLHKYFLNNKLKTPWQEKHNLFHNRKKNVFDFFQLRFVKGKKACLMFAPVLLEPPYLFNLTLSCSLPRLRDSVNF